MEIADDLALLTIFLINIETSCRPFYQIIRLALWELLDKPLEPRPSPLTLVSAVPGPQETNVDINLN